MILSTTANIHLEAGADPHGELVCWSRMQAEAGQPLANIVLRKEWERRAGQGLFFWGVGNAPSSLTATLARLRTPVTAVFSIMKGKPKQVDVNPPRTLVWRSYFDLSRVERDLPPHVLVTSRGDTESTRKKRHYALMCYSDEPLRLQHGRPFDSSVYRNVGGGSGRVGSSQVTALLRRACAPSDRSDYEANLTAMLTGSYWVRLSNPCLLAEDHKKRLARAVSGQGENWSSLVATLRSGSRAEAFDDFEPRLL